MEAIKILIVEDDIFIGDDICAKLRTLGYDVAGPATNVTQAKEQFIAFEPDIVIMDIILANGDDGIETAGLLQRIKPFPLIFLTNLNDSNTLKRAIDLKPSNYLVKPFALHQLAASIETALLNYSLNISPVPGKTQAVNAPDSIVVNDHVFIREGRERRKYQVSQICFIEADGAYCNIHLRNGTVLIQTLNMRKIWEELNHPNLLKTSRFSVVNVAHIERVKGDKIWVAGTEINLSKQYKEHILDRIGLKA